jgi:hypothetical protein
MPMKRDLYPVDWEARSLRLREQAGWRCVECGRDCVRADEDWYEFVMRQSWTIAEAIAAAAHPMRYRLTAAHVNHDPQNDAAELRAWCAPCHARYDLAQINRKRLISRERAGQLTLGFEVKPHEI